MKIKNLSSRAAMTIAIASLMASTAFCRTASFAEFDARARMGERLNVVYFGASLMYSANATDPATTGFRGLMSDYLQQRYPKAHFKFHDAAIGGTPSKLGLFRLQRDVLSHDPDLVFLDFVCNDGGDNVNPDNTCAYEQILRTLIEKGVAVEQVFFTFKWWMDSNPYEKSVPRQLLYKNLAKFYNTPFSDTQALLKAKLAAKETTMEELWPIDGGHPADAGYRFFFAAAQEAFDRAVADQMVSSVPREPLYGSVGDVCVIDLAALPEIVDGQTSGWSKARTFRTSMWYDGLSSRWLGEWTARANAGARSIELPGLKGNYLAFFGEADGKTALPLKISVDGGEEKTIGFSHGCDGRLFVFRDYFLGNWQRGEGEAHTLRIGPGNDGGKPNGELRVKAVFSGTFKPTPIALKLFKDFGRRDFRLDDIDHARGRP